MAKVSVIIPVYNVEAYLPACLDSVLTQTLTDIEVICIDDASPDNCGRILDEYAARDARIKVIHLSENRHQGYGRNRGLETACGEYVYFLDSDDMITPNALEELYALAKKEDLEGVFFDGRTIYESKALAKKFAHEIVACTGRYKDRVYTGQELLDAFIRQGEWTCYVQRQFWNRAFLMREHIRTPEGVIHEDEAFALKAILSARRTRYIRETYFIRRFRENSVMTSQRSAKDIYGYLITFCDMNQFIYERGLSCEAADIILGRLFNWMMVLHGRLSKKEDLESWFKTPEERKMYYFFLTARKADYMRRKSSEALKPYVWHLRRYINSLFFRIRRSPKRAGRS